MSSPQADFKEGEGGSELAWIGKGVAQRNRVDVLPESLLATGRGEDLHEFGVAS